MRLDVDAVRAVIESVRPMFVRDGGDIELVRVDGCDVYVRMHGACVGCPSVTTSLQFGVESKLREELYGFGDLIVDRTEERSTPRKWWQLLG